LICPNKGEELKPLSKIASGGEMSRFMLALKNITASLQGIDTLIFDEIDTGISGKTAMTVAQKLWSIGKKAGQVLAVSHLAQLSSYSDGQFYISKNEVNNRTVTTVEPLDEDGIIREIARLSGGDNESDAALLAAKRLRETAAAAKA
jgi:DNA repair protein RecN (Recombination protein N)